VNVAKLNSKTRTQTDQDNNIIVELSISDCSEGQEVIEWREKPQMNLVSEYTVNDLFCVFVGITFRKFSLFFFSFLGRCN
jgi:hypothetical protein